MHKRKSQQSTQQTPYSPTPPTATKKSLTCSSKGSSSLRTKGGTMGSDAVDSIAPGNGRPAMIRLTTDRHDRKKCRQYFLTMGEISHFISANRSSLICNFLLKKFTLAQKTYFIGGYDAAYWGVRFLNIIIQGARNKNPRRNSLRRRLKFSVRHALVTTITKYSITEIELQQIGGKMSNFPHVNEKIKNDGG